MFGFRRKQRNETQVNLGRRVQVAREKRLAAADVSFRALIGVADQARNRADFTAAVAAYRRALQMYPLHPGYWAQLGHALKESNDFCGAEVAFRTAMALGERDVAPHLAFVAGDDYTPSWTETIEAYWRGNDPAVMATPPTARDVADAIELLCDRGDVAPTELRDLMRVSPSRRELLAHLMRGGEFRRYHADLLRYVAETGWGQ